MAAVYGPKEVHPKHLTKPDRAIVKCRYHMTPFSTDTRKNPSFSRREIEISKVIRQALEPAIILEDYPRSSIEVYMEVLQSDGGSRCAALSAASVALADAGINMRDLVAGCAAGKIGGEIVLDIDDTEDKEGEPLPRARRCRHRAAARPADSPPGPTRRRGTPQRSTPTAPRPRTSRRRRRGQPVRTSSWEPNRRASAGGSQRRARGERRPALAPSYPPENAPRVSLTGLPRGG